MQRDTARTRALRQLARLATRHPHLVLLVGGVLALAGYVAASFMEVKLALVDAFPEDAPERRQLEYVNDNFGSMDLLFVVLEGDDEEALKSAAVVAEEAALSLPEYIASASARVDVDFFRPHGLLFLEQAELVDLVDRAEAHSGWLEQLAAADRLDSLGVALGEGIDQLLVAEWEQEPPEQEVLDLVAGIDALLADVEAGLDGSPPADDPAEALFSGLTGETAEVGGNSGQRDGWLFSQDGQTLLVPVWPRGNDYDYARAAETMTAFDTALGEALADSGVRWSTTGNVSVMRDEFRALRRDMLFTTGLSLVGVLALFLYIFRRLEYALIVGLPLAMGIGWTLGLAWWQVGSFNLITSVFAAVLLGLGIDFAIHLVSRFREGQQKGLDAAQAVEECLVAAGPGVITGGLTTAAAFFVLTTASFKGMSELGWIAGTGILCSLLASFTALPALLSLLGDRVRGGQALSAGSGLMAAMAAWVAARPGRALLVTVGLSILALAGLPRLGFLYDFRALEPPGLPAILAMERVEEAFDESIDYGILVSDDLDQERAFVAALEESERFGRVDALSRYLPDEQPQRLVEIRRLERSLAAVQPQRRAAPAGFDSERAAAGLERLSSGLLGLYRSAVVAGLFEAEEASQAARARAGALAERLRSEQPTAQMVAWEGRWSEGLADSVEELREMAASQGLTLADLPPDLVDRYRGRDGKLLVYGYPAENIWEEPVMRALVGELQALQPEASGIAVVFLALIDQTLADFIASSWGALALVVLFLWLDFRRPLLVLLALTPLLAGTLWMVGAWAWLGQPFNFINITMVPILLGIGIDDGVHILHRYLETGQPTGGGRTERVAGTIRHTGRAVLLTSLTTMVGFGAIGGASSVGLASLGQVLFIGIGTCFLTSTLLLPALLGLLPSVGGASETPR